MTFHKLYVKSCDHNSIKMSTYVWNRDKLLETQKEQTVQLTIIASALEKLIEMNAPPPMAVPVPAVKVPPE